MNEDQEISILVKNVNLSYMLVSAGCRLPFLTGATMEHQRMTRNIADGVGEQLFFQLRAHVLSDKTSIGPIEIPKTWWDHFKIDVCPKWFVSMFPPKYRTINVDANVLFPYAKYLQKDIGAPSITLSYIESFK